MVLLYPDTSVAYLQCLTEGLTIIVAFQIDLATVDKVIDYDLVVGFACSYVLNSSSNDGHWFFFGLPYHLMPSSFLAAAVRVSKVWAI